MAAEEIWLRLSERGKKKGYGRTSLSRIPDDNKVCHPSNPQLMMTIQQPMLDSPCKLTSVQQISEQWSSIYAYYQQQASLAISRLPIDKFDEQMGN
jgi:hypothetical protein